jgi:hypothetical protein
MRITMRDPRYLRDRDGFRLTATVLEARDLLPDADFRIHARGVRSPD